jgi:hypothetical protein
LETIMVIGMFGGWPGQAVPDPPRRDQPGEGAAAPRDFGRDSSAEIIYSMRPAPNHNVVVTVVSSEVCLRKCVERTGHVDVEMERAGERLRIRTEERRLALTVAHRTLRFDLDRLTAEDLVRLRSRLAPSGTIHALRTLATVVDETESDTAERLSLRLTGALIAQFAGEPGAARRLSRELHARYGPQLAKGRRQVPRDWLTYQKSVVRACAELQLGIAGLSFWDPARHTCALTWITQTEAAWHTYVTTSAAWRSQL